MRNEPFPQTRVVDNGQLQEILAGHATPAREQSARVAAAPLISKRVLTSLVRLGDSLVAALIGAVIWHVYLRPESYARERLLSDVSVGRRPCGARSSSRGAGLYSIHAFLRPVEHLPRLDRKLARDLCRSLRHAVLRAGGRQLFARVGGYLVSQRTRRPHRRSAALLPSRSSAGIAMDVSTAAPFSSAAASPPRT